MNSDIICSASGFRSCSRKIRDVLVWCHHLRHQVTSLPSSWSWGCTVPMTTTEHFFQVFKASRREMAKKKFIQEQVCCDLRVPCKFPAHHRKIYVTPSYWRYTPPPSPLFPLLPLLKKTTTNRETKDLKTILEMFIKLRARQSSDCAALLWVHQLNRSTDAKNCSQIDGSQSLSVSSNSGAIFILVWCVWKHTRICRVPTLARYHMICQILTFFNSFIRKFWRWTFWHDT